MTASACHASRLGVLALAAALTCAACANDNWQSTPHLVSFASPIGATLPVTLSVVPQTLGITPLVGIRCATFPSVTSQFGLVVNVVGGRDLFMQQVTMRLLDGSHVGGSPLLVSAGDLSARFGSTIIPAGTRRTFTFDPQFGCGTFVPVSLFIDIILVDNVGSQHAMTVTAPIG